MHERASVFLLFSSLKLLTSPVVTAVFWWQPCLSFHLITVFIFPLMTASNLPLPRLRYFAFFCCWRHTLYSKVFGLRSYPSNSPPQPRYACLRVSLHGCWLRPATCVYMQGQAVRGRWYTIGVLNLNIHDEERECVWGGWWHRGKVYLWYIRPAQRDWRGEGRISKQSLVTESTPSDVETVCGKWL